MTFSLTASQEAQLAAEFERKTAFNNNKNARKKANKKARRMKQHNAVILSGGGGLGPNGEYPVHGQLTETGWETFFPKLTQTSNKWEDDPWAKATVKTPEEIKKEKIDENLKYWPWWQTVPRKLVTLAPFTLNYLRDQRRSGQPFALPEVEQTCGLFTKLLGVNVIRLMLAKILFQNHNTAWKFAATSRQSWKAITAEIATWDFTRGVFGKCENPRDQFIDGEDLIRVAEPLPQGSVPAVVIVSPVRGPKIIPANIEDVDELKFVVDLKLYENQARNLHKMCLAMTNFADFFRNLQLHRIPFLTTDVLSLIIPMMRNLTVLGVYKCQLIHVGDTLKLLDIIQTDKPQGKENQIALDFYPNYHVGPISYPGNMYCTGSYGPVWDNWNGDTNIALWQLISVIIPKAQAQKQDFVSPHTMFRQWFDKSPCWRVEATLATLIRHEGDTRTDSEMDEDFIVMVDFPNTQGSKTKFFSKLPNRPEGYKWMLERVPCSGCGLNPLGIFFYHDDIRQATNLQLTAAQANLTCMGCRLTAWLNAEKDHYKFEKRKLISHWLREDDGHNGEEVWNRDNMSKALTDFGEREVLKLAKKLDNIRKFEIMRKDRPELQLDREHDELQVPFTKTELGRLGMKNVSPTVDSKDPIFNEWNEINRSRLWAHGHGVPI